MAKKFCIPKNLIKPIKEAVSSVEGGIEGFAKMSEADRLNIFDKYLNRSESIELNKSFEKAAISRRAQALNNWAEKNIPKEYGSLFGEDVSALGNKFKTLQELDNWIEGRMELMAEQQQKVALTPAQTKKFTQLGEKFYSASKDLGENLGNPKFMKENLAWGKAHKDLMEYREGLLNAEWWDAMVNNIGRVNMLASVKTPFLNIESNIVSGGAEALVRRFENGTFKGIVDKDLIKEYSTFLDAMWKDARVDFTRMINMDDTVAGIGRLVGEKSSKIPGKNKVSQGLQAYSDFIFNTTLTTPDVKFAKAAYLDSLAIQSTAYAKGDKNVANKLFKEAMNFNSNDTTARMIRENAIADARRATYTNDTKTAQISENVRTILNKLPLPVGDILMPFVKTVGNVAELSADYSGLGLVKGAIGITKEFATKRGTGLAINRNAMRKHFGDIARSGVGITAAFLLAANMDPENFMGAYDPKRIKINQLDNVGYNAVKLKTPFGDKWVNVSYLGPLAAPFVGMMYAKKYGNHVKGYVTGATSAFINQLPIMGAVEATDIIRDLIDPEQTNKIDKLISGAPQSAADTIASRLTPGILYDIARATDTYQRDTGRKINSFAGINWDKFIQKIPYLRQTLPIKHDALGRMMYEESPVESLLFGARVKTSNTNDAVNEIYRLDKSGYLPTIKDLRFMYSSKVDELKAKTGDKFYDIAREYGERLGEKYEQAMRSSSYKNASDEKKKDILDKIGQDLYVQTLQRNGVKYR